MKKSVFVWFVFGLLFVSLVGFVSAASAPVEQISKLVSSIVEALKPLFELIVGDVGSTNTSDIFFAKIIMLAVLLAVIYSVVSTMGLFSANKWVLWVLSLGVSILGVRFLTAEMVETVILSNSAMAIAMTAIIPFIIYAFFVEKGMAAPAYPGISRKFAWYLFAAVFTGLYFVRSEKIGSFGLWVYGVTVVLAVVFALLDGTIQGWLMRAKIAKAGQTYKKSGAITIQKKIADIQQIYESNSVGYIGNVHSTASAGKSGTDAYLADLAYFETELHKLLV